VQRQLAVPDCPGSPVPPAASRPPTSATILRRCRCLDCRLLDRNDGGCDVPGRNDTPDEWHYCAGYDGPQISRDVLVFRHERQPACLNEDQADAWRERVAICTVDGGLTEVEAEAIAAKEIAQDAPVRPCTTRAAEGVPEGQGGCQVATRANGGRVGAFHDGHAPRIRSAARRPARVADMGDGAERRQWPNGGTFDHCFIYAGPPRMACLRPDYDSSSPESQVLLARCCSARRQIGTSSDIRRW